NFFKTFMPLLSQLIESICDWISSLEPLSFSLAISRSRESRLSSISSSLKDLNWFIAIVKKCFGQGLEHPTIDQGLPAQINDQCPYGQNRGHQYASQRKTVQVLAQCDGTGDDQ